jgi:hypothetical protein
MPDEPKFTAKVKGDAGSYKVWGIDWMNHRVLIERPSLNWEPIKNITFIPTQDEQLE